RRRRAAHGPARARVGDARGGVPDPPRAARALRAADRPLHGARLVVLRARALEAGDPVRGQLPPPPGGNERRPVLRRARDRGALPRLPRARARRGPRRERRHAAGRARPRPPRLSSLEVSPRTPCRRHGQPCTLLHSVAMAPPEPMTAGGIDVERSTGAGVSGYRAAIHAFSAIAEASAGEHDLDVLLHHVGREICALLGVRRCSVYLRDDSGIFRGQIGHADHDIDAKVKRLVAGVEADGFTREIVATRRPVFVQDTTTDPRPIRSTMREWRVRAMLGVPMIVGGETIGILFLDNEDEPHGYAEEEQELAATFANLAAVAIRQAQLTSKLRESLRLVGRQNYALRRAAEVDAGLTRLVLEGADLRQIVEAISQLTGKPWAIYDAQFRRLADAALPSHGKVRPLALEPGYRECAAVTEALETLRAARTAIVSPDRRSGLQHRHLVAAVTARDETWGYLVTMDYGSRLEPLDRIVADRAATMVALELSAARRAALARSDELESLASDLIRGDADAESLERRASFIGVRLAAPHALCFVKSRGAAA